MLLLAVIFLGLISPMVQEVDREQLKEHIDHSVLTPWINILKESETIITICGISVAAFSLLLIIFTLLIPSIFSHIALFYMAVTLLALAVFTLRYLNFWIPFISK